MHDEKLLHFLTSRVNSRGTVYLALSTLTSSASLVLLGIFFSGRTDESAYPIFVLLGVGFPAISIIYTELTLEIHFHDLWWIRKIIQENNDSNKDTEKILVYSKYRTLRVYLSKILFIVPIFAWSLTFPDLFMIISWEIIVGWVIISVRNYKPRPLSDAKYYKKFLIENDRKSPSTDPK